MKAIMISIKPKWCAKIMNGDKTIEIRKTCPAIFKHLHSYEGASLDVYIYCTKDKETILVNNRSIPCTKKGIALYCKELLYKHEYDNDYDLLNGKVVAKFTLNKVEEIIEDKTIGGDPYFTTQTLLERFLCKKSCLTPYDFYDYFKGKKGYAWHISNLEIFDKPKELSEFHKIISIKKCDTNYCDDLYSCSTCDHSKLTKAPQSWCYVGEEIMGKEPTPLEALENLKNLSNDVQYASKIPCIDNELKIIEKSLKALEIIKKHTYCGGWSADYTTEYWKMKAQEIKLIEEMFRGVPMKPLSGNKK